MPKKLPSLEILDLTPSRLPGNDFFKLLKSLAKFENLNSLSFYYAHNIYLSFFTIEQPQSFKNLIRFHLNLNNRFGEIFELFLVRNLKYFYFEKVSVDLGELHSFIPAPKSSNRNLFFCRQQKFAADITRYHPNLKTLGFIHDVNRYFFTGESLILEKAYLPIVPSKCIFPNLKCLHLNLDSCFRKRDFHRASIFTQIEELKFHFHRVPKFSFNARLINRMENLKRLIIDQTIYPRKIKEDLRQWKTNKYKYCGTSIKLVQWSWPSYFNLSPVLKFFKKQGIQIENTLPKEDFSLFNLRYYSIY
jgi:hypothetical protein